MKTNDDAIRRALRQAPPPPLPEGFTLRLMERVRRKACRRERIETALLLAGGIALFGALIAASLRRLAPEWHPEWPGPGSLPRIELPVIPSRSCRPKGVRSCSAWSSSPRSSSPCTCSVC